MRQDWSKLQLDIFNTKEWEEFNPGDTVIIVGPMDGAPEYRIGKFIEYVDCTEAGTCGETDICSRMRRVRLIQNGEGLVGNTHLFCSTYSGGSCDSIRVGMRKLTPEIEMILALHNL